MEPLRKHFHLKIVLVIIIAIGALITFLPSFFNWWDIIKPGLANNLMLLGTIIWFLSTTYLLNLKK